MDEKYSLEAYAVGLKKKIGFENKSAQTETLVLGSSHGQYSFIPQKGEYNLCLPSQDLYYSYALYNKYCSQMKQLKNIILYYSVFSRGFELVKSSEDCRCYHYEKIFGLKPSRLCYEERLNAKYAPYGEKLATKTHKIRVSKSYLGENPDIKGLKVKRIGMIDPAERAMKAYKHYMRKTIQDKYILKILKSVQKQHQHLILIIPPAHEDYKKALPDGKILFEHIFKLATAYKENMTVLDFYNRNDFDDCDWWDYDHLNPTGAEKFTKLYRARTHGDEH